MTSLIFTTNRSITAAQRSKSILLSQILDNYATKSELAPPVYRRRTFPHEHEHLLERRSSSSIRIHQQRRACSDGNSRNPIVTLGREWSLPPRYETEEWKLSSTPISRITVRAHPGATRFWYRFRKYCPWGRKGIISVSGRLVQISIPVKYELTAAYIFFN